MTRYTVETEVPADCAIEEAGETVTVGVDEEEYVLAAARAAGVWQPADCQQGWCTTCAARLLEGKVDQSDSTRSYGVDDEAEFTLLCTARPRSGLRVCACQPEAMLDHPATHDLPPGREKHPK